MNTQKIKTAIITGGHPYEVMPFHQMFRELEGVDAYVQSMDEFATSPEEMRDSYDVVGFYHMLMEGPPDNPEDWLHGNVKAVLEHATQTGQGLLMLHHSILAYPQWDVWSKYVGIENRAFGFHPYETIKVVPTDVSHPITDGVSAWEMVDETYTMDEPDDSCEVLLTVDHPKSMKAIAWTKTIDKTRVFSFQSGHDHITWDETSFRTILERGIQWCSGK